MTPEQRIAELEQQIEDERDAFQKQIALWQSAKAQAEQERDKWREATHASIAEGGKVMEEKATAEAKVAAISDALRALAEKWRNPTRAFLALDPRGAEAVDDCANELVAILEAKPEQP